VTVDGLRLRPLVPRYRFARVRGRSVKPPNVDSLAAEIERVRDDEDFTARRVGC
jgi:hypothetical protein